MMTIEARILTLAYIPKSCTNISEWRPFKKDTLGEIIDKHNKRCKRYHEKDLKWTQDDIEKLVEVITVVPHDLNWLGKLSADDFESIWILLANLDEIQEAEKETKLNYVKAYMQRKQHKYYLTQVSEKPSPKSLQSFFSFAPVYTIPVFPPQLITTQKEYEDFLWRFSVQGGSPPKNGPGNGEDDTGGGKDGPKTVLDNNDQTRKERQQEYVDAFSKVKNDIRHAAIVNKLSDKQTLALTELAVEQELALREIEKRAAIQPYQHLVLNKIREPVFKLAVEPLQRPVIKINKFVHFQPALPMEELNSQQRGIFKKLGVKNNSYSVIDYDQEDTRDLLQRLGNSAKVVNTFVANIPDFKFRT